MPGLKRIVVQTLERASSADFLRSAAFTGATFAEVARAASSRRWPLIFPGTETAEVLTGTPLRGDVHEGLLVRVDVASYLTIDPGVVSCTVTPGSADDSPLQVFADPGVSTPGALAFTANPSASPRYDVVECQPIDTTLETATRGIWDTVARVFNPTPSLPKVAAPRMSYRIRWGTAGSGIPAGAAGWMPLAVLRVLQTDVGFTTCNAWDVRPLVADRVALSGRVLNPAGAQVSAYNPPRGNWTCQDGIIDGIALASFDGYLAGGVIAESSYSDDPGLNRFSFNPLANRNASGTQTATAAEVYNVAAVFPRGYPRWVRYTNLADPAVGKRVPRGPRGVLLTTQAHPDVNGLFASLPMPTAFGDANSYPGVHLLSFAIRNGGGSGLRNAGSCAGGVTRIPRSAFVPLRGKTLAGTTTAQWDFTLSAFKGPPQDATWLELSVEITKSGSTTNITLEVFLPAASATEPVFDTRFNVLAAGGYVSVRVPLPLLLRSWTNTTGGNPDAGAARVKLSTTGGDTITDGEIYVTGWGYD